jgi:hypothetical protein
MIGQFLIACLTIVPLCAFIAARFSTSQSDEP